MKIKNQGFSVMEFIMIIVVLGVVGVFVYFASKSREVNIVNNSPATNATIQVPTVLDTGASVPLEMGKVIDFVKQLSTDAESRYNGTYKAVLTASNSAKENGSGIVMSSNSVGKNVVAEVAKIGGKIFAITNDKINAYALYITLPNRDGRYYCLGSDGSKANDTAIVTNSAGLINKPICK